ncbi:cytochrome P450 [Spirillospora sp. CA-128828]|uniref:cytochrome P450 n=1 Tax=Spirillospora sp. CA-128828 TaxID=3240033 RepID=UPI003D91D628
MTFEPADSGPAPLPDRVPLYGPAFAADPASVYELLRRYGPVAPVELAPGIPATLVTSYEYALEVLRDADTFPKDARRWQRSVPSDCPVLPLMQYRPTANLTDGAVHDRLRQAVSESLAQVDVEALRGHVEQSAELLIDRFGAEGAADLRTRYALPLPLLVFNRLCGVPAALGDRLVAGMSAMMDGGADAENANRDLAQAVAELVALKRREPGADVVSWLMAHPARLNDEEMAHQIVMLLGTVTEPEQNLIINTLRLLLADDRFAGDLSGGSLAVQDALDEILWSDPPIANYGITYPVKDVDFAGVRLPADQPVVVSYAAANTDPSITRGDRTGNRAHLAFSAGDHTCAAKGQARLIASVAIEKLLDRLPDMRLAVPAEELTWRTGWVHRALVELPVVFPPSQPAEPAPAVRDDRFIAAPVPAGSAVPSGPPPGASAAGGPRSFWGPLARRRRGGDS